MADQTTKQPQMTPEEAVKIIYLAKQAGSEKTFRTFQEELQNNKIPWSFTNERFLEKIKELKDTLIAELNLQNEELANKAAEESFSHTLSSEEREGMMKGLDQVRQQEKNHQDDLLKYTGSLVDVYVKKLKEQSVLTPEQESSVRNSVSQAAQQAIQGDASNMTKEMARAAGEYVPNEIASSASESLELPPETQDSLDKIAQLSKITETALIKDEVDKGALIERCLIDPTIDPEIIASKNRGELQATKILSLSDDVKLRADLELDNDNNRKIAFRQATENAKQGISQPINDVVTAVGGPQGKEFLNSAVGWITGESLKEYREKGTIGGKRVEATLNKIQQLENFESQQESATQASPPPFKKADIPDVWKQKIQQGMLVYLESTTVKVYVMGPEYFHYFILAGTDVWNSIIGRSTRAAASGVVKKAVVKGGEKAAAAAGLTAAKVGVGIFGGPIGTFLALAGDRVVSFVWGGIKGLSSFLQLGEIAKGIMGGFGAPREKKPLWTDMSWILPIACVAGIIILSGFTFFRETTTTAAIVAEKEKTTAASENQSLDLVEKIPDHPTEQGGKILNFTTHCIENHFDPRCAVVTPPPQGVINFKADKSFTGSELCAGGGGKITNWKQAASERVKNAISQLEKSQVFIGLISTPQGEQTSEPINIYYIEGSSRGGGCYDGNIYLYNAGGSTDAATLYTLAHELGHVLADRQPDIYKQFIASGITNQQGQGEGWLQTYPNKDYMSDREDFAETIAMYASDYKSYPTGYTNHYNFAKSIFGNVELR